MKKCIALYAISIGMMFFNGNLQAAIGCLDDKLHVNECGIKRYTPICCTCPCWRYEHSL